MDMRFLHNKYPLMAIMTIILHAVLPLALFSGDMQTADSSNSAERQKRMPHFSWDHVQCYMHIRKDTAFTREEVAYLAQFPLITFEKTTGARGFGSTEKGTLAAARAIKAINPKVKILFYWNVFVRWANGAYDSYKALNELPGQVLLTDRAGKPVLIRNKVPAYDLTNPAVREWWITTAQKVCSDPAIDGVFVDAVVKVMADGFLKSRIGEAKKQAIKRQFFGMMKSLRERLGPDKLMVGNLLRSLLPDAGMGALHLFDGSYMESFCGGRGGEEARIAYTAKSIRAFQEAARAGYLVAFTKGWGHKLKTPYSAKTPFSVIMNEEERKRFYYALGLFLICAEKYSYFLVHDGYDAKRSHTWMMKLPDELRRPLGSPKGPAQCRGHEYRREFAHASVRVDIAKEEAKIQWH